MEQACTDICTQGGRAGMMLERHRNVDLVCECVFSRQGFTTALQERQDGGGAICPYCKQIQEIGRITGRGLMIREKIDQL